MILSILLYSKQKNERIIYKDMDGIMTSEIELTFLRKCDVMCLRAGGAKIRASQKSRDVLDALEKKYDVVTKCRIRKLKGFISKLAETDEFYFFNEAKTNVVERRTAIDYLNANASNDLSLKSL